MIEIKHLPVRKGKVPLRVAHGHFATNHSHINYYIDITYNKTRLSEAKDSAYELVSHYKNDTPIDTILCLDGTAVLGTCVAEDLATKSAPKWLDVDKNGLSVKVATLPARDDVDFDFNEQLIVELYSK